MVPLQVGDPYFLSGTTVAEAFDPINIRHDLPGARLVVCKYRR
jgi:hypothetical protein